jgi:serine O-acetyltransferase
MFDNLRADFAAASEHRKLEKGWWRVAFRVETPAIICYRYTHYVLNMKIPLLRWILLIPGLILQRLNQMFLGIFISPDAEIGPGFVIHTPGAVFVGPAKIGKNCTVQSCVVIGNAALIGDNVYFGSGAKVIGDAKIGNNVLVVANSVILTDVKDNTTIMGNPARIRLPGGRPKLFPWKVVESKKAVSET